MKLKEELAFARYHIMRLRTRGLSTKPQNYLQEEVTVLQNLCTSAVQRRDDLARTLDKAEAHIKFLENELRARSNT